MRVSENNEKCWILYEFSYKKNIISYENVQKQKSQNGQDDDV